LIRRLRRKKVHVEAPEVHVRAEKLHEENIGNPLWIKNEKEFFSA
jgi:hypothetical protein